MISQVTTGFYNALKLWAETWVVNTTYALNDVVKATTYNSHTYKCVKAGTSHAQTEPTWSTTDGATIADNTVTWQCFDTKTYNVKPPLGVTVPCVSFGIETDVPIGTFTDMTAIESLTFWVNCFAGNLIAEALEVADEVMAVLDNANLTVTGYSSMVCRREFIGAPIWDEKAFIWQIPMRYRVMIDKT